MGTKYRADIDGLRAIAVVPVVLYHLQEKHIDGGFVGVDIFFVISGYLITQLIYGDIQQNRYSVVGFYVRRARRIFPALFVMCAACTAVMLAIYLPGEVAEFKSSLIAATLFVSNLYFYFTQDYFAAAADTKPLLHTWSLAVEEQFYIFFPLLLLASHRYFLRSQKLVLIVLALLSLAICAWLEWDNPPAAFYLIHARAWELLVGALLAIGAVPAIRRPWVAEALGALGLGMIAVAVFGFSETMPLLGIAMLVPCLGAACVIHSGAQHRTWIARALALPPMRGVGLISYSLYLWHWPVDVVTLTFWNPYTRLAKAIALTSSFAFAILSWKFVEQPFRRRPYRLGSAGILSLSGAVMTVLIVMALAAYPLSNRLWVIPEKAQKILSMLENRPASTGRNCFLNAQRNDIALFDRENCLRWSDTRPNFLLLGDSMAADIAKALEQVYPEANLLQATSTRCKPVLNTPGAPGCSALVQTMLRDFIPTHDLDAVIISARWNDNDIGSLVRTVDNIKGYAKTIVILGPRVEYMSPLPRLLAMSLIKADPGIVDRNRKDGQEQRDRMFAARLKDSGVHYFSVYQTLCPAGGCLASDDDGMPLESDYGHFTANGSIFVISRLKASGAL